MGSSPSGMMSVPSGKVVGSYVLHYGRDADMVAGDSADVWEFQDLFRFDIGLGDGRPVVAQALDVVGRGLLVRAFRRLVVRLRSVRELTLDQAVETTPLAAPA